jgi:hypothetical protein
MTRSALAAVAAALLIASTAGATDLFTPPLLSNTPAPSEVVCSVLNAGPGQVDLEVEIRTLSGLSLDFGMCSPRRGAGCTFGALAPSGAAVYCFIVVLTKGEPAARGVRGVFHWLDADGVPSGTVVATQ